MKKVLIITYYWPPCGGIGVQRWVKFVKYCREMGWEPVIYTAENPEYPSIDQSFDKDIPEGVEHIRTPIWEPYTLYKKLVGRKKDDRIRTAFTSDKKKKSRFEGLSVWLRGNFFIPDARCFWIKPSVKYLTNYLKDHPVDAIISNGPPHTVHMIAKGVKEKTNVPWIADFRDPWTQVYYFEDFKLGKWATRRHEKMELQVLKAADVVTTVTKGCVEGFKEILDRDYKVITNGFDHQDFDAIKDVPTNKENFEIVYAGSMPADRNPMAFWDALKALSDIVPGFKEKLKVSIIGEVDFSIKETVKEKGLESCVHFPGFLPYQDVIVMEKKAQVLMANLPVNDRNGIAVPGKVFDYLAIGRPILFLGPDQANAAEIIRDTHSGMVCDEHDQAHIQNVLHDWYKEYEDKGTLTQKSKGLSVFTRKHLTRKFVEILNGLLD